MTLSKAISTVIIAVVSLAAANLAQAQTSYSKSWETSSSWNSTWSSGPGGTHTTYDETNNFKSNESSTIGGRTISVNEDHTSQTSRASGIDQFGVYNNELNRQNGKTVVTDKNRVNGPYGSHLTDTQKLTYSYDNSQGLNQNLGWDGSYNQTGFDNQSANLKLVNNIKGRDFFGNGFGQRSVQEINATNNTGYGIGFDRYGNQVFNQQSQDQSLKIRDTFRRW